MQRKSADQESRPYRERDGDHHEFEHLFVLHGQGV